MPGQEFYTTPAACCVHANPPRTFAQGAGVRGRKERGSLSVPQAGRKQWSRRQNAAKSSTRHLLPVPSMQILKPVCLQLSYQRKLNQRTSVHSLEAAQQRALHRVWSALPVPSMQILHQWLAGCSRPSRARVASVHRRRGVHPSIAGAGCSCPSRSRVASVDRGPGLHCGRGLQLSRAVLRPGMQPRVRAAATCSHACVLINASISPGVR